MKAEEKRLNPRKYWKGRVVFEDERGEEFLYLNACDISLGGVFLERPPPVQLGTRLLLSFVLPGKKRPLRVTGQVMRFLEEGRSGIGVRFVDLPPTAFHQLAAFLSR